MEHDLLHIKMLKHCRTCTSTKTVSSIYDELLHITELSNVANLLIHIVPQLTIKESDGLPKHLCQSCLNKLLEIYEFQQMCLHTEEKWLELLRQTTTTTQIEMGEEINDHNLKDPLDDDGVSHNVDNSHKKLKVHSELTVCENHGGNDRVQSNVLSFTSDKTIKVELSDLLENQYKLELFNEQATGHEIIDNDGAKIVRVTKQGNGNHNQKKSNKRIKKFTCNICGKALSASGVLNRHIKQVHRITKDGSSHNIDDDQDDHKTRNMNIPETINQSEETPVEEPNLNVPNNDKYNIIMCSASCNSNNNDIEAPQKNKLDFTCNICGKNLSSSGVLNRHRKQIHGIVKEKKTQEEKILGSDSKNVQNNGGLKKRIKRPHICKYCNKAFSIPTRLRDHERVHTGERPHLCPQCGLGFKTASNLIQHLYRHKGDKRYECPHCPKRFICLADLGSHKAVHNKERPHACDICGSSFAKSYLLRRHKMYHSDDKPHKCDYCDMRFVMACQMRSHRRIHTGEKPYKCKYCPRVFARSTHAARHLRSHLGANIHGCELCPQRFRLRSELRAHFISHKNEDDQTRCKNLEALKYEQENLQIRLNVLSNKAAE